MAWQTWTTRIAQLPNILAGPILRRVEPGSVTVWLAMLVPCRVTLRVFTSSPDAPVLLGTWDTIQVAPRLHIVSVTAVPVGGQSLAENTTYQYNVHFAAAGTSGHVPTTANNLQSPDYLRKGNIGPASLGYGTMSLPSFALPPADLNSVRIFHGSCRKPHGGGEDALVFLDGLIQEQAAQPLLRPHMLFLTGDQIYADDVADSVLAMLEDAGRTLGFPNETIPEYNGYPLAHTREPKLEAAGLTGGRTIVDEGTIKSHLITLAEYCAMYLFAFSDVFWQADQPSYFDTFRKNPPVPTGRTPTYDVTKYQFDQENKGYANFRKVTKDTTTTDVAPNLLAIRKALANIPTYMIFDDHEITDDWLLDRAWVDQSAGNTLAKRVIQNGLAAYALFQAWGNDPAEFQTQSGQPLVHGEALLHAIRDWAASNTEANATNLQNRLGMPTGPIPAGQATYPQSPDAVKWYYRISFPRFHVVVLDTRTQRAYAGKHDHPALLSLAAMQAQTAVSGLTDEQVLLVISPAPFVGNPDIESLQTIPRKAFAAPYLLDAEFWIGQELTFQRFLARLVNLTGTAAKTRIVILSGDVHYGYTARVRYSAQTPLGGSAPAPREAVIAQLTCSAFKNEGFPGTKLHVDGVIVHPSSPNTRSFPPPPPDPSVGLPDVISYCWNNPSKASRTIGTRVLAGPPRNITGNVRVGSGHDPIVYEREYGVTLTAVPDWRIRTRFIRSEEPIPRPNQPTPVPANPTDRDLRLRAQVRTASNHVLYQRYKSAGANAVGLNNLGEVTFQWGTGETKTVVHRLFWRLDGENVGALGRYRVSMALTPETF